jgi:predicted HTH transcriptional regulator
MRTNVKDTSLDAFDSIKHSGMQEQQAKILAVMEEGQAYTRRELSKLSGIETSSVSSRVNAMLEIFVAVVGIKKCSISGRNVEALVRL